ncbi:MAG TPA: helix-turn-helix domain-containing protein [Syntrophomonadaceae bacterium]|nr:helix-turn-helix domain-containing protein [Syntrophomonadaceae bacterium]HPR93810.1 helix-turn-helix domain-containing protein [Syntrophomonadaceae bacterium]
MLRLDNGVVIDAEELTAEQREAYIEFAIHLAAPSIAKMLSHGTVHNDGQDIPDRHVVNEAFFDYPPMMTVKQAAELLNVGQSTVREMERRWNGKFFPAVRMGNSIRIPSDRKWKLEMMRRGEIKELKLLEEAASDWDRAQKIRRFTDDMAVKINEISDEQKRQKLAQWVKWAEDKADWLDPLIDKEDELLGKNESFFDRIIASKL